MPEPEPNSTDILKPFGDFSLRLGGKLFVDWNDEKKGEERELAADTLLGLSLSLGGEGLTALGKTLEEERPQQVLKRLFANGLEKAGEKITEEQRRQLTEILANLGKTESLSLDDFISQFSLIDPQAPINRLLDQIFPSLPSDVQTALATKRFF